jgi:uncharacterized protein (DUF342 family)
MTRRGKEDGAISHKLSTQLPNCAKHKVSKSVKTTMAGRTLRNRTVETSQDDDEIFTQQSKSDWLEDQPQQVGSEHELDEVTEAHSENIKLDSTEELENMLSSVLAVIQQTKKKLQESNQMLENKIENGHKQLQDKMENSHKELKDTNTALEKKTEAKNKELREINNKFQKDMEIKFQGFQENVKRDIRAETEQLTISFESETRIWINDSQ